jgi:hypothetical protein
MMEMTLYICGLLPKAYGSRVMIMRRTSLKFWLRGKWIGNVQI